MVIGTGIDYIEVSRVADAVCRSEFLERLFTKKERECFLREDADARVIAGAYAAKEAAAKALSVGYGNVCFRDIEILRHDNRHEVVLYRGALERLYELSGRTLCVNISHIKELAVAQAILED